MRTDNHRTRRGISHLTTNWMYAIRYSWAYAIRPYMLFVLFVLSISPAGAQYVATVVDVNTHMVLPFASVYVSKDMSTITNLEGTFAINCAPDDVLRISYVGYKTALIKAEQLGNTVTLEPQETILSEVLVIPIQPLIDKICKETLRMSRKYKTKKNEFFYRQTAFSDSTCYEFAEAFLSGGSAVSLHNLELLSGRYAGLQPDSANAYSFFGNFYTFSALEVAANYETPKPIDDVVPLFRNFDKFYDVTYEVTSEDGNRIFVLHFEPKPEIRDKYAILAATLYVDEKTYHLRRIVGKGINFRVVTKFVKEFAFVGVPLARTERSTHNTEFSYVIDLSDERGFPEVQSAFVEAVYKLYDKTVTTRSLLYNLSTEEEKKKNKRSFFSRIADFFSEQYTQHKGEELKFGSVLHQTIDMQGYDPEFWNKNEIVLRTPIEEEVMRLFESQNLFGVMSP